MNYEDDVLKYKERTKGKETDQNVKEWMKNIGIRNELIRSIKENTTFSIREIASTFTWRIRHVNLIDSVGATQRSGGFTPTTGNMGGGAPRQGRPRHKMVSTEDVI